MKPYAESCDQNREPILEVLKQAFASATGVLEIGSGTGQHAVYFAAALPYLHWQTSDRRENHAGIQLWLNEADLQNLSPPLELDVDQDQWPHAEKSIDGIFSANTAHIMSANSVKRMFQGVGGLLPAGGRFVLYGPFNYAGQYTSGSNAEFDAWLQQRDPWSGIRDFELLQQFAHAAALSLWRDFAMPANNRCLVWEKMPDQSQYEP